jgi:hypothetical protein
MGTVAPPEREPGRSIRLSPSFLCFCAICRVTVERYPTWGLFVIFFPDSRPCMLLAGRFQWPTRGGAMTKN